MAGLRAKAKRRALDWQHKVTHALAEEFGVVGIEDLNITQMTKSARGTVDAPGANVAQNRGLNRAIATQAWGRTITLLEYELADRGGHLVRVPAPNTSRRCSRCQAVTEGSRKSQDRFVCKAPGCGYTANADTNAARNIEHAVRQQAPQDIVGARTWSPRRQAG
ncbi:RNA-guided endonuclease InsQ/TnpB family protein [Nocardiopsis sp. M1B1]|uniref:RNA-guided endonuclease InsQ/TnpB family protein n=1 Tax=Nocardiopsis sp. M1B1 TaxID=3450454 RepID=UPI004039433C